jgi:hypothetical protein
MKQQFFLFVECDVGMAHAAATAIRDMKLANCTEIALISGRWDILIRSECDSDVDVGRTLVTAVQTVPHVRRTRTEIGFPIYDPADIYFDEDGDV